MGYYTSYSMTVLDHDKSGKEISKVDADLLEDEVEKMNVFESGCLEDGWYVDAKWYEFEDDMLLLSTKFPNMVFCLEGSGEDTDDRWIHYYNNGMVMYDGLEIVFKPFDPTKLVKPSMKIKNTYQYQEDL